MTGAARTAHSSAECIVSDKAPPAKRRIVPIILIVSLFFLWGMANNLNDILIPHFKRAFALTDFQSSYIQVAFFGGYFLAALPAGWLMERLGYKRGILMGLALCAAGALLFVPASSVGLYSFFLFALFVMACGQSFLEAELRLCGVGVGQQRRGKLRSDCDPLPSEGRRRGPYRSDDRSERLG